MGSPVRQQPHPMQPGAVVPSSPSSDAHAAAMTRYYAMQQQQAVVAHSNPGYFPHASSAAPLYRYPQTSPVMVGTGLAPRAYGHPHQPTALMQPAVRPPYHGDGFLQSPTAQQQLASHVFPIPPMPHSSVQSYAASTAAETVPASVSLAQPQPTPPKKPVYVPAVFPPGGSTAPEHFLSGSTFFLSDSLNLFAAVRQTWTRCLQERGGTVVPELVAGVCYAVMYAQDAPDCKKVRLWSTFSLALKILLCGYAFLFLNDFFCFFH